MAFTYDRKAGQYRGNDGRFVPRREIESLIDREIQSNQRKVQSLTGRLVSGEIELGDWQRSIMDLLRDSHLRLGLLGSGGKNAVSSVEYGAIGNRIKDQYRYLAEFAKSIEKEELSEAQVRSRIDQYAKSSRITFHEMELKTRAIDGFKRGRRLLDLQSKHCAACIAHEKKEWVNLSEIVAPGVGCQCRSNCRCRLFYSRF